MISLACFVFSSFLLVEAEMDRRVERCLALTPECLVTLGLKKNKRQVLAQLECSKGFLGLDGAVFPLTEERKGLLLF